MLPPLFLEVEPHHRVRSDAGFIAFRAITCSLFHIIRLWTCVPHQVLRFATSFQFVLLEIS